MIPEFFTAQPEIFVVMAYSSAIILNETFGRRMPGIGRWRLAEVIALATSLYYQFIVVAPSTGLENVFASLTGAVLFGVLAKELIVQIGLK